MKNDSALSTKHYSDHDLLDTEESSNYLKISKTAFMQLYRDKKLPAPVLVSGISGRGSRPRWFFSDLVDYARSTQEKNE
jgi:hypothetical protein